MNLKRAGRGLRVFFGLVPEDEGLSRRAQRWWFLAIFFAVFLLGIDFFQGVLWGCRALFALLALHLFLDGAWGFSWAGKRLLFLGGWYLLICGGEWVSERFPEFPPVLFLPLFLLALSCLWPLCVTGDIAGFPYYGAGFIPSCFLVWCGLALAWVLGWGIRKLRLGVRLESAGADKRGG